MSSLPTSHFPNLIRTDFWFSDGNIILITQNAAFKVHKGQLARHSEVFGDLFSLPQPSPHSMSIRASRSTGEHSRVGREDREREREHLIDGCPFVVLQDSPNDVFYFLSALYDGLYFTPSRIHSPSFHALSAVLRLSTKYLVEPLVQRCLFHLYFDWPTSLSAWDDREARFTLEPPAPSSSSSSSSSRKGGRYIPREFCPHPILIIQFAQEMNLPEILPAAMYDLSRYGPSKIMNGTVASPTTYDRLAAQLTSREWETPKSIRLSRELLCQILRGREQTQRFLASFLEKELYSRPPSPFCLNKTPAPPSVPQTQSDPHSSSATTEPSPGPSSSSSPIQSKSNPCSDSFYHLLLNTFRSVGGITFGRDADALFTLTQAIEMLDRTDFYISGSRNGSAGSGAGSDSGGTANRRALGLDLCQACRRDFKEKVKKAREEMWGYLPRWFGLVGSETGVEVS